MPLHPVTELQSARSELLAALQGYTPSDLLTPGVDGTWSGRDVLLHIGAWLRELADLVPDLARFGYQRGEPFDPGPEWEHWHREQIEIYGHVRPEAAVAGLVTAHARLVEVVSALDEAGLRRRGPTRFGFESCGWDLLLAEADHERKHAAQLAVRRKQSASLADERCKQPGPLLRAS